MSNVVWVEGPKGEGQAFISALRKKGYHVELVSTGVEAVKRVLLKAPDLVVINAASLRSSGKRICANVRKQAASLPIVLILSNEMATVSDENATAVVRLPFTTRKLLNALAPLMPWADGTILQAGPIRLNLGRRLVESNGKITRLTPSLTHLLERFISHHGEVIERDSLFRQVWNTDYTGDTRTLDVHISWLRQAIEENPHEPVYLKTIRGVGYRLDL